jgi:hypothetical protein
VYALPSAATSFIVANYLNGIREVLKRDQTMSSDILLNDGTHQDRVTIQATVLHSTAADLIIDSPARRSNTSGPRRALVHDGGDGLTVNFNHDYPGGVTLNSVATLSLKPRNYQGGTPQLPKTAEVGSLILLQGSHGGGILEQIHAGGGEVSLWLCVGSDRTVNRSALWKQVQLGGSVKGTE